MSTLVIATNPTNSIQINEMIINLNNLDETIDINLIEDEFDVDVQIKKVKKSKNIIFLFPAVFNSTPSILNMYMELVFSDEIKKEIEGKNFTHITTFKGSFESYSPTGDNRYKARTYMIFLDQFAKDLKMNFVNPSVFYNDDNIKDDELKNNIIEVKEKVLEII